MSVVDDDHFLYDNEDNALEDEFDSVLFGVITCEIVGHRFYKGQVENGQLITFQRDPDNPYDKNAIKVMNVSHLQVGHVPRGIAKGLASVIDRELAFVEGVVVRGADNYYSIPMRIELYGMRGNFRRAVDEVQAKGVFIKVNKELERNERSKEEKKARPSVSVANVKSYAAPSSKQLDELLVNQARQFSPAQQPVALSTMLSAYQLEGLAWLSDKESASGGFSLWQRKGASSYFMSATNTWSSSEPEVTRGGLLCDEMGLGKTIQVLALIVANQNTAGTATATATATAAAAAGYARATLIVVPAAVLSSWQAQIEEHVQPQVLRYSVYHGAERGAATAHELGTANDIVLTTFGTLVSEFDKGAQSRLYKVIKII